MQSGNHMVGDGLKALPVQQDRIVIPDRPHKHPGTTPLHPGSNNAGVFKSFPTQLQHQPLLRIHRDSLARRNTKEIRIKMLDLVQEPIT